MKMEMNDWQIMPKRGISLGEMRVTFEDSWQDICQKLNLGKTHNVFELHHIGGCVLNNILNSGASIRFEFQQGLLFEILFFDGNLFFDDVNFINCEIEDVLSNLRSKGITILYDSSELAYICPSLRIYFGTHSSVGGDGTEVCHVGICKLDQTTVYLQEVTNPVSED
jgi:hypothetical protein